VGRIPALIGKCEDGYCVSFESFAYEKLGYTKAYELGPGEIVEVSSKGYTVLKEREEKI
jgi:amidophosphoribosyltransferase